MAFITGNLTLIMIVVSFVFIGIGLLTGLKRGAAKAMFRLILSAVSVILALVFKDVVLNAVLKINIQGKPLIDFLMSMMPPELADAADQLKPLITIIAGIVAFIVLVLVSNLLTYIVFLIFGGLVGKGKGKIAGMITGALCGTLIAIFVLSPVNSLALCLSNFKDVEANGKKVLDIDEKGLEKYYSSPTCKFYSECSKVFLIKVTTIKDDNGKTLTLEGQSEAAGISAKLGSDLSKLSGSGELNDETVETIKGAIGSLGALKGASDEVVDTVKGLISSAAKGMGLETTNIDGIDFKNVDYEKEADLVGKLYDFSKDANVFTEQSEIDSAVKNLADSELLFPVANDMGVTIDLSGAEGVVAKGKIEAAIEKPDNNFTDEQKAQLRKFFGIPK